MIVAFKDFPPRTTYWVVQLSWSDEDTWKPLNRVYTSRAEAEEYMKSVSEDPDLLDKMPRPGITVTLRVVER